MREKGVLEAREVILKGRSIKIYRKGGGLRDVYFRVKSKQMSNLEGR